MNKPKKQIKVHVVSDATGITAERVISAVLVQFEQAVEPVLERHSFVSDEKRMGRILDEVKEEGALLIYSLVSRGLRRWVRLELNKRNIHGVDLMGPLLAMMGKKLGAMPMMHPGLLGDVGEASMRLAESIEFTLRHDDGQAMSSIGKSDVIILGASRSSKTPTSLYLSCNHNLKVSNIPLIRGQEPPSIIFNLKRPKIVGFTIDPGKLMEIRKRRYKGRTMDGYNDLPSIWSDLTHCEEIYKMLPGILVIDVTRSPIEEVANQIVQALKQEDITK